MLKRKRNKRFFKELRFWLPGLFILFLVLVTFVSSVYFFITIKKLPSLGEFNSRQVSQSTKIYDRTGQIILYEIHGEEKRTVISFDEIPKFAKEAVLAVEDSNFYARRVAFDWRGILRAVFINLQGNQVVGGSTITQQLARNVFLSPKKTLDRKLKELILAIELESKYSKDEILNLYLNQIPYGGNAYGIEAASQIYFDKSAKNLTLAEAATLAGIIKRPTYYSPWGNYKSDLLLRKDYVLDRMNELGFISENEEGDAKNQNLIFAPQSIGSIKAPHFSIMVKEYLVGKYGEDLVENGGLKVISTLNADFQELAEKAVLEGSVKNEELYGAKNAAMVVEDPKTGQILALVGSRNYFDIENDGNFNVVSQGLRQPGSALKPFVYMTAFEKGYTPKTVLFDVPTEFDTRDDPEKSYKPENFDGKTRGPVAMENALGQSLNIPAVKTLYLAGFDSVLKNLHLFGITSLNERWRYGLSLTLGGGEVKLIDLVNAYGTLSQDGVYHKQSLVLKIEDSEGKIIEEYKDENKRVINEEYPRLVTQILSNPELRRPIFGSSLSYTVFPDYEVALKTGTSEDHRDAWTIGYTKSLIVGVWAGNNDNVPMIRQGSSILAAVPIWNSFFKEALKKYEGEPFEKPTPIAPSIKSVLNGEYVWSPKFQGKTYPQIHSILYYINKSDPQGPPPENPETDSQFKSWESSVVNWAAINVPDFNQYNKPVPEGASSDSNDSIIIQAPGNSAPDTGLNILNTYPANGDFIKSPLVIKADLFSSKNLAKIEIYLNKRAVNQLFIYGNRYHYEYYLNNVELQPQNLIEFRLYNNQNEMKTVSIIVFK